MNAVEVRYELIPTCSLRVTVPSVLRDPLLEALLVPLDLENQALPGDKDGWIGQTVQRIRSHGRLKVNGPN